MMRLALEHLLHCSVPDRAWLQAGLASKDGGLGMRHLASIAHPAYIGSTINAAPLVATLLGRSSLATPGLQSAASVLLTRLGEMAPDSVRVSLQTISLASQLDVQCTQTMPAKA